MVDDKVTVVEAIRKMVSEKGNTVFLDSCIVNSYIADLVQEPGEQLILYRIAVANGILELMFQMSNTLLEEEREM